MATTYKGLTIRIGADTSKISDALKRVNSAANSTQSILKNLQKALDIDPDNLSKSAHYLEALGNNAESSYRKVLRLGDAYESLSNVRLSNGSTTAEFLKEQGNAIQKVADLHERFDAINAELAKTYNEVEKISGVKLDNDHLFKSTPEAEENIAKIKELGVAFDKTKDDAVSLAEKLQGAGFDIPDSTIDHIRQLRANFNETQRAMTDMNKAAGLQQMTADLDQVDSASKRAAQNMVRLNNVSTVGKSTNVSQIKEQIQQLDNAAESVSKKLRVVDNALKLDPSNVVAAEQRMTLLGEQEDIAQQKATLLRQALSQYDNAGITEVAGSIKNVSENLETTSADAEKAVQKWIGLKARLSDYEEQLEKIRASDTVDEHASDIDMLNSAIKITKTLVQEAGAEAKSALDKVDTAHAVDEQQNLNSKLEETNSLITDTQKKMGTLRETKPIDWDSTFTSMRDIGQSWTNYVTQPLVRVGQYAIEASDTVDSAFRDMKKTVNGSEEDFANLRQAALDFSTTHVTSADQILEIEAMGGQLGIAVEDLQDFANTASNLDIATDIDADTISQSMGQLVNIMDDLNVTADSTHGGLDNFADSLVRLGNNSPALESAIMDITTRIASQANIIGMSTPEVLAWSTALASTGQNSEAAGTALSKTMSQIESAVGEGGNALQGFADVAGESADEFAAKWSSDPSAALEDFIRGLQRVHEEGGSMDNTLAELGITAVRQKQGIEGLTQTLDTLDSSLTMSNDAWNGIGDQWGAAGDAAREAEQKSEGFSGALGKLQNSATVAGDAIGQGFLPYLNGLADIAGAVTGWLNGLSDGAKTAIVTVGGVAAAIGPLLTLVGTVGPAFKGGLDMAKNAATALSTAITGVASSGALLPVFLGSLAVGAIAAFAMKTYEAKKRQDEFNDALSQMSSSGSDLSEKFAIGSRVLSDYQGQARETAMSIEDLTTEIQNHNQTMSNIKDSASDSISMLGQYKSIIDQMGGQGAASAEDLGKLEWALQGLNSQLNTNFTAEDVLSGKYTDEQGNIQNTIEKIDELITKRQEEARVAAAQEGYTEALKEQMKLQRNAQVAQDDYNSAMDEYNDLVDKAVAKGTDRQAAETAAAMIMSNQGKNLDELKEKMDGANRAFDESGQEVDYWSNQMTGAEVACTEAGKAMLEFLQSTDGFNSAAQQAGISTEQLAGYLAQAGISTEQLNAIGSENFAQLAANCGGDIGQLIASIELYNSTPILDKDGNITVDETKLVDAYNNVYTWNGSKLLDKDGKAVVNDVELTDAYGNLVIWNGTSLVSKEGTAKVTGNATDGTGEDAVKRMSAAITNLKDKNILITANIQGATKLEYLKNLQDALHDKSITYTTYSNIIRQTHNLREDAKGGIRAHASGGIIPHADGGYVYTRPTMIDYQNLIGEAGPEYYDGNHIVPLAGRYGREFAATIAQEIAKLGISGVNQSNYYIGDTQVTAMSDRDFANAFVNLMARYRGVSLT